MVVLHPPSGTTLTLTKPNIPRDLDLQQRCFESLKSHNFWTNVYEKEKHTIWPRKRRDAAWRKTQIIAPESKILLAESEFILVFMKICGVGNPMTQDADKT
jgi:hypothetical protein